MSDHQSQQGQRRQGGQQRDSRRHEERTPRVIVQEGGPAARPTLDRRSNTPIRRRRSVTGWWNDLHWMMRVGILGLALLAVLAGAIFGGHAPRP